MTTLPEPAGFEWDDANEKKIIAKHGVTAREIEEAFFDADKKLLDDRLHSGSEARYLLLGRTRRQRLLFVIFTIRGNRIRAISARNLNKRERPLYEKAPESSEI